MKKILSIIIVALMGLFILSSLYTGPIGQIFPKYGEAELDQRVSSAYVHKNVNQPNADVEFGKSSGLESGAANIVTSIVVDYRSFDTLGEVTVLFVSALGVSLVMGAGTNRLKLKYAPNFILKYGTKTIVGLILITGTYIFIHGHLTPGGGFPGGSMIATALLLLYIADDQFKTDIKQFKIIEGTAGSLYVIAGLLGITMGGYFLMNFLPNGTVGKLFSAGLIPIVYILIGLKVGSELTGIVSDFFSEEAEI